MRLSKIDLLVFFGVAFSLFLSSCLSRTDNFYVARMPKYGFQILLPKNVYSGADTMLCNNDIIVNYVWKGVSRTSTNKNVFYNVAATTYPSHLMHSDSIGLVQLLFTDREPAYFMNNQYELVERNDLYRFGYPGARFVWYNKEDNSQIYNHYYMVENKLYYLSIVLPTVGNDMILLKDEFIDSFKLIHEKG